MVTYVILNKTDIVNSDGDALIDFSKLLNKSSLKSKLFLKITKPQQ